MTFTNRIALVPFVYCTMSSAFGFADQGFHFITADASQESAGVRLNGAFMNADADVTSGTFDPLAGNLLSASQAFTEAVFNIPSLELIRATSKKNQGDILVAKWSVSEPFAKGLLILKDLPYSSQYEFKVTGVEIRSKEDIASFLSTLLRWGHPPTNFAPSAFYVYTPGGSGPVTTYSALSFQSSSAGVRNISISAAWLSGAWFVEVQLGKNFTKDFYPVTPFVPERFPPLEELVKSWSFGRIWSEVGRPVGPNGSEGYSEPRDGILVAELIRRGITEEQFVDLLSDGSPTDLGSRAQVVLYALQRDPKGSQLSRYFGPALTMYQQIGPRASKAVEELFRSAAASCSMPYEAEATRLLRSGAFPSASLLYLGRCSVSRDALDAVGAAMVPDELIEMKQATLANIRRRLGLHLE